VCGGKERSPYLGDHFIPEIIDVSRGEMLPFGPWGELVFTTLTKEAFALIR